MVGLRLSSRQLVHLLADWRGGGVAYRELADAIRLLVLDRRVPPGSVLPSERDLAVRMGLSRTTVATAYGVLRERGIIRSSRGSGSVVQAVGADRPSEDAPDSSGGVAEGLDLYRATPPAWTGLASVVQDAAADPTALLARPGYDTVGSIALRTAVAERYTAAGLPTDAEQILITSGAQSAIALVASTFVRRGERVVLETPTYPHAAEVFRAIGAQIVSVPVTPTEGWDLDLVERVFRRAAPVLAYLMPDFHNPTGASMSTEDRTQLLRAASETGTYVVVDETTAELALDPTESHRPIGANERPGLTQRLITIGSLGKTVWGGLRVGWVRAEHAVIARLVAARPTHDLGTPEFEQAIAERCMARMPEILESRARQLREGRDALISVLSEALPEWEIPSPAGGVALWIGLGEPVSSALVLAARERGVVLSSGPRFGVDGGHERFLRVPFTAPAPQIALAAEVLIDAWQSVRERSWDRTIPVLPLV